MSFLSGFFTTRDTLCTVLSQTLDSNLDFARLIKGATDTCIAIIATTKVIATLRLRYWPRLRFLLLHSMSLGLGLEDYLLRVAMIAMTVAIAINEEAGVKIRPYHRGN